MWGAAATGGTPEDWDGGLATNLKSMMLCCKYSIPWMIKTGGGSIINISSLAGAIGMSGTKDRNLINYSTTKAGMSGFTRALAAQYAEDGIRVNCIVVGMVETPLITANYSAEVLVQRRKCIPLQTPGTGWDVGWAAVYLASDESRWVTAIDLFVDGGQTHIVERPQ
jgi:NAD(P)-dependent dehydrogenase (short-subunit alcohol dehydrogenase family)